MKRGEDEEIIFTRENNVIVTCGEAVNFHLKYYGSLLILSQLIYIQTMLHCSFVFRVIIRCFDTQKCHVVNMMSK